MILPPQIRLYAELAAAAILLGAFTWYTVHERAVGATAVHTADAKALGEARKRADAESELNLVKASKAEDVAANAQKAIDDYRAAHPVEPVRLCHPNNSVSGMRQTGAPVGGAPGAGAGSSAVREVQDGTPGPDIGAGLDALVQAAGRLAVVYADRQQR